MFPLLAGSSGVWHTVLTVNRKLFHFGAYPAVSLKDVRQKRQEAKEHLAKDIDPGEAKKEAKAERYTFEEAGKRWLEHHATETVPSTHKKSRMYIDSLNKKIGKLTLPELDRKTLVDAVQAIQGAISIHFAHRVAGCTQKRHRTRIQRRQSYRMPCLRTGKSPEVLQSKESGSTDKPC
jgi:hypothetical protein